MTTEQEKRISELLPHLEQDVRILESVILSTSTGPRREKLTEANIHLYEALSKLKQAQEEKE